MNQVTVSKFFLTAALVCLSPTATESGVAIKFNNLGLSSLSYKGVEYLSSGSMQVKQVEMQLPDGGIIAANRAAKTHVYSFLRRLRQDFSWGWIRCEYRPWKDRLDVAVTVHNNSRGTIKSIWLELFELKFPSPPSQYDGNTPILANSNGQPAVVQVTYSSGAMAIASEDGMKPVQIGLPWSLNKPVNTTFPVSLNTGRVKSFSEGLPTIQRPIGPGADEMFSFSLRFGPAESATQNLGRDLVDRFVAANPPILHWEDRRPIGALFLSTASAGWPNNPRGWLQDRNVDVCSDSGIRALKARVMAYADGSIQILKRMNAQGMITWDIEGQQFPHPASYVGDPRLFDTLAPEMSNIADDYFRKFRDAGLRVGVCIRPQRAEIILDGKSFRQVWVSDPTQLLIDKVQWAKRRWGATLFYVDSNVNSFDLNPINAAVFRTLTRAFPDTLFIPEHSRMLYHAYSAPYKELRQGYAGTSPELRGAYPGAFTVIYTADGPIERRRDELTRSVRRGDILMFRAWYDDPQNALIKAIYDQALSVAVHQSLTSSK